MRNVLWMTALAVGIVAAAVPNAWAQTERVRVSGTIAGAVGDGGSTRAVGVAGGFQLARHAGLEIELIYIPDQEFDRESFSLQTFPPVVSDPRPYAARTLAFLSSFVTHVELGRFRPSAQFGGGVANLRRQLTTLGSVTGPVGLTDSATANTPMPVPVSTTDNRLALSGGGGLDFRFWRGLSLGADLRYLHLVGNGTGEPDVNITRIGARIGWWF